MVEKTKVNVDNSMENYNRVNEVNDKKEVVINKRYIIIGFKAILFSFLTVSFISLISIKIREISHYTFKYSVEQRYGGIIEITSPDGIENFEVSTIINESNIHLNCYGDFIPKEKFENNKFLIYVIVILKYLFTSPILLYLLLFSIGYAIILFVFNKYKFKIKA